MSSQLQYFFKATTAPQKRDAYKDVSNYSDLLSSICIRNLLKFSVTR